MSRFAKLRMLPAAIKYGLREARQPSGQPPPVARPAPPPVDPTEFGLVPDADVTSAPVDDPALAAAVAGVATGDWRPAAAALADTGQDWELRGRQIGRLGTLTADDDAWLRTWQQAEPANPDHAVVLADSLVKLAWQVRGALRAQSTSAEQFAGFHRVLRDAVHAAEAAAAAVPDDPAPWVTLVTIARGLEFDHDSFHRIWRELVARSPNSRRGHDSALQYWCEKWFGSHELMHEFADTAAASSPSLSALPLAAAYEHVVRADDGAHWRHPSVAPALEQTMYTWLTGLGATSIWAREDRSWTIFPLVNTGRYDEALHQFRALGEHADAWVWSLFPDPVDKFRRVRALACRNSTKP